MGRIIGLWFVSLLVVEWARAQDTAAVFGNRQALGSVDNPVINEASGLVASWKHTGYFWTHNDSGDKARIFLIDNSARHKATYYLQGISAYDWEDIGMMERDGHRYLLIGDIGDNRSQRPHVQLHVVKEPDIPAEASVSDSLPIEEVHSFLLRYEDGPRDAESLFFDPIDERLYIISKRELEVGVYATELPKWPVDTLTLRKVCVLPHTFVTSAAIRANGTELLIKNLIEVFYWKRRPGETIGDMLSRPAMVQPYQPEPQGEAITFARDGSGYYTISEAVLGMKSVLYFYPRF
ncbi:MAG TPA: hypothetical protein VNQ55_00425 [Parapedobacter sp.]|nr:hypothetical protein [Parapedobacter sp.]